MIIENIPDELKKKRRWILWKYDDCNKPNPYYIGNSDDKCSNFEDVVSVFHSENFDGLAFDITDTPYSVIRIKNCFDPGTGEVLPYALDVITLCESYTQISQSYKDIEIVVEGAIPVKDYQDESFEMFDGRSRRVVAMTGESFGELRAIRKCLGDMEKIFDNYIAVDHGMTIKQDMFLPDLIVDANITTSDSLEERSGTVESNGIDDADFEVSSRNKLTLINPLKSKETLKRYTVNDRGNGYLFADTFKQVCRYCPEAREWYVYDGKIWRKDTGGTKTREYAKYLSRHLYDYISGIGDDILREQFRKNANLLGRHDNREDMLKDAQTVYPLSLSELDTDSNLFNCQNGTLRLDTLKFTSHSDRDNLSMMSGVSYKPGIVCLRWIQFIDEVTEGDADKARFIQKAFGYALLGSPKEECLFMLYGETTRNGKGVTMSVITRIFGDYAKTVQPETLAVKKYSNGSGPTEDLARLRGARLVNINEPSKGMRLDVAKVKTMTGRDKITARFLHQGSFEFIPGFSIMINTNHLPSVDDETLFTSGRVKVISFDRHFSESEQDKSLKDTLTEADSLSGVFNWVLEGLRLYRAEGLGNPCSVVTATAKYHLESDKEALFLYENTQAFEGWAIRTLDLYKQYTFWCQKNNHPPLTIKSFSSNLSKKGYTIKVMRWQGSDKVSHVLDTELKPQSGQNLCETNTG